MNLIFEFYSVSIVSIHQIFITRKRQGTQGCHFETPFLLKSKQKTNLCNLSKKKCKDTYLFIFYFSLSQFERNELGTTLSLRA